MLDVDRKVFRTVGQVDVRKFGANVDALHAVTLQGGRQKPADPVGVRNGTSHDPTPPCSSRSAPTVARRGRDRLSLRPRATTPQATRAVIPTRLTSVNADGCNRRSPSCSRNANGGDRAVMRDAVIGSVYL